MANSYWITADRAVTDQPILLLGAVLVSDGTGAADATLYQGSSTSGSPVMVLRTQATGLVSPALGPGIALRQGLYVDMGSNVEGLLVVWEPLW